MNISEQFVAVLRDAIWETGRDFHADMAGVQRYAAERMAHLATIPADDPHYLEAVRAERDSVALRAAINVTRSADGADAYILGVIGGALALGARAL